MRNIMRQARCACEISGGSSLVRILLLNYEFPPLGGGAATASAQIARHLAGRGVEVAVLTSHFQGLDDVEQRDGYTIYRVPAMRSKIDRCSVPEMGAYVAGAVCLLCGWQRHFRPDLMHVFFGMPTGPVGLMLHKLKGIPDFALIAWGRCARVHG